MTRACKINPRIDHREHHDKHVFFTGRTKVLAGNPTGWCREMHGRGQGCLRGQKSHCRIMMFETDPAMSRSAIHPWTIAASISRWSSCLTSRWTHPQRSGSGSLGGPTCRRPSFRRCSSGHTPFGVERAPAAPHRVQHHGQFARDRDVRPLEPDAVAQLEAPATKGAVLA